MKRKCIGKKAGHLKRMLFGALVAAILIPGLALADTPYGNISGMAIVSPTQGYFVGYAGWGDNTLYRFDPSAADPTGTAITGLQNKNISGMESGVYLDENSMLWVCNQTDGRIDILDTSDDSIDESVSTNLNPSKVALVSDGTDQYAVASTVAADWSSGAHSVVSVDPVGGPRTVTNDLEPSGSDMTVVGYGRHFYRMERSSANNITKYDVAAPRTYVWQYSTEGSDTGSNPHDLVFVSETKAYLLRYGTDTAWIVNPSAATEADFKIGELDLSAYTDNDGAPEMHSGVIADGKLYIALQRIDFSGGWGNYVYNTSYVAVFDTTTDQEVDTGQDSGGMLGVPMLVKNLGSIQYLSDNATIYVQGTGQYGVDYSGGIASLDPTTYATAMVLDDGEPDPPEESEEEDDGGDDNLGCFINTIN